jgi:hypothetical protein
MIRSFHDNSILSLCLIGLFALPLAACSDDRQTDTRSAQQGLEGVGSQGPGKGPGDPVLCDVSTPACNLLCYPLLVDPGRPGYCCNGLVRTTCYEAGFYTPGDKDADGVPDNLDHCIYTADPTNANHDTDTWGDVCDNCDFVSNQDQYDFDHDGVGNACDPDLDGDGVANHLDNCPNAANSNQANADADARGDACDNCPKVQNDDQANSDQDSAGDACDWSGYRATQNQEAMMISSPWCSASGYSLVDNCINQAAPLPPSINRGISTARNDLRSAPSLRLEIDDKVSGLQMVQPWADQSQVATPVPGQTQVVPFHRSSNDGRLLMVSDWFGSSFVAHRPERLGAYDRVLTATPVHSRLWKPLTTMQITGTQTEALMHATLCDQSGSERVAGRALSMNRNPRACTTTTGDQGDCYDVSWLGQTFEADVHRISSLAVTVFVGSPKTPIATTYATGPLDVAVFPQGMIPNLNIQPNDADYQNSRHSTGNVYWTRSCACESLPCAGAAALQSAFFEPTTSSDGRLLMINMGGTQRAGAHGVYYAIAPPNLACRGNGFELFKPLSCLPTDSRAQGYGLAQGALPMPDGRRAFRGSKGEFIDPGVEMPGAYMWLDRKAKNLFYSQVNDYRDAWKARQQNPPHRGVNGGQGPPASWALYPDQHPSAAGNGVVALGAWTQGKIIVMDNVLNPTDWTGGSDHGDAGYLEMDFAPYNFEMPLYQEAPRWIRPGTSAMINSPENQLNYLNNQNPTSPFDVVWRVATNTNHNAEVIFDEYMLNDAFVVAHMNSPHTTFGANPTYFPDDGFVPNRPASSMRGLYYNNNQGGPMPEFRFNRSPLLQNAATSTPSRAPFASAPPSTLRLRGGARVEPVALGGVRGKGVFLDGVNDFIDMGYQNTNHRDWFYGLWLDPRDLSLTTTRTVLYWADGSWVGLSGAQITSYDRSTQTTKTLSLPQYRPQGEYFHLGVKVVDIGATSQRKLSFYLNGTPLGILSFAGLQGFAMDSNALGGWSWFVVGDPGPAHTSPGYPSTRKPWMGWIDEFRIYALTQNSTSHFEEFICNLAMGSLVNVAGQARCEQLNFHTQGHPVDVPAQSGLKCADKVHKNNSDPDCLRTQRLGIASQPLSAQQPRPDLQSNHFCLSCHLSNHSMQELSLTALPAGSVNREDDMRRQPLDWPGYLGGQSYPGASGLWPDVDRWLHTHGKVP